MLELDAVLLEQCLFNILDNAAKYTQPGTAITLGLQRDREGLAIIVEDEGSGFGDRNPALIFGKFTRFAAADTTHADTGLGLAIVRGFTEAMGARLPHPIIMNAAVPVSGCAFLSPSILYAKFMPH